MNALVVSLKFNPGHFSHLTANYKLFQDAGLTPYLYLHPDFRMLDDSRAFATVTSVKEIKKLSSVDVAVFWFPSIRNIFEIIRLRLFYKSFIIYIYHEPFDSFRSYYRSGFTIKKIAKICLINLVNIPVILMSHRIVLPSAKSLLHYRAKYTLLNSNFSNVPLLFDDEANSDMLKEEKNYISYIGNIAADHAFDRFVRFADFAITGNLFPEMKFAIASRIEIPPKERAILEPHITSGKVLVCTGHPMTNDEINGYYRRSLIVWNAYNRSMQSGVLPKAFMFGAPVITLAANSNEFFDNHVTGVAINDNHDLEEIARAVREIMNHRNAFITNSRKKFLETYFYKKKTDDFMNLIPPLKPGSARQ